MSLEKWKTASVFTKVATACVVLSALVGLIIGFITLDALEDAFGLLNSFISDIRPMLVVYLLVYYLIDIIVAIGLLFIKNWAKSLATWWGILAAVSMVLAIKEPHALFVSYILSIAAAVCLFLGKEDFPQKRAHAERGQHESYDR
ncbi:MAG: hypothetical protein J6I73_08420 [Treponema sp.]|nr:hypothetical protein [Treponema sp.]